MLLEVCANSYQSALNAQIAGAQRIELCSELNTGGITPSYGLLKEVSKHLSISTYVLIRPRSGNFSYSNAEFNIMKSDIEICKKLGFDGIVSGVLQSDNTIDIERTNELIQLAKPLKFTFHRAFDCVENPREAILQLIDLGVDRVLTSGQEPYAEKGIKLLVDLQKIAKNSLIILPGGGIKGENSKLFKAAGFKEIHASASMQIEFKYSNSYFDNEIQTVSDIETIQEILNCISNKL